MPESFRTRLLRWQFNFFPVFRRTGARITYLSDDFKTLKLALPLNWKTKNYVGTIYGGSMYSAVDGILMVMLINLLGRDVIVWDKSGSIRYRKPGRSTLTATFEIGDGELRTIRERLETEEKFDRNYRVDLIDKEGDVCAEIDKLIHFRRRA